MHGNMTVKYLAYVYSRCAGLKLLLGSSGRRLGDKSVYIIMLDFCSVYPRNFAARRRGEFVCPSVLLCEILGSLSGRC